MILLLLLYALCTLYYCIGNNIDIAVYKSRISVDDRCRYIVHCRQLLQNCRFRRRLKNVFSLLLSIIILFCSHITSAGADCDANKLQTVAVLFYRYLIGTYLYRIIRLTIKMIKGVQNAT